MTHHPQNNDLEEQLLRQAQQLSHDWKDRLDEFMLPCPLCKGELLFQGVYRDRLYEFAENEPGVINPMNVLPISFICNRCGFTAEFDSELFNPSYLAQLAGAEEAEIEDLRLQHYRVLIPMSGSETSNTLLKLGTALAGEEAGEVVVLNIDDNGMDRLEEKLHRFTPAPGNPAPLLLRDVPAANLRSKLAEVAGEQKSNVLLIDWRNWLPNGAKPITDIVTTDVTCDVCVVHDRGLPAVHRILLLTGGSQNARAAAPKAISLAKAFEAELHILHITPKLEHPQLDEKRHILGLLGNPRIPPDLRVEYRVVVSDQLVPTLVDEAGRYDLLVIGASNRDWRGRVRMDSVAARIIRNSGVTALLVRARGSLIRSWFRRILEL
jgi:nucleotide-binding universal stress UspA family protein